MGAGHYAINDEKNALGEARIGCANQVRRVDTRWKIAPASFPRLARGQETDRSDSRDIEANIPKSFPCFGPQSYEACSHVIPSEWDRDWAERRPHKCATRHASRRDPSVRAGLAHRSG